MKMYKCDKCGKQFADEWDSFEAEFPTKVCHGGLESKRKHLDCAHLCQSCTNKFYKFILNEPED